MSHSFRAVLVAPRGKLRHHSIRRRAVSDLSVGQQQRVAAARALIGSPGLIIADEPTSALDTASQDAFLDLLNTEVARTGAALIFVSHNEGIAEHFDRQVAFGDLAHGEAAA